MITSKLALHIKISMINSEQHMSLRQKYFLLIMIRSPRCYSIKIGATCIYFLWYNINSWKALKKAKAHRTMYKWEKRKYTVEQQEMLNTR